MALNDVNLTPTGEHVAWCMCDDCADVKEKRIHSMVEQKYPHFFQKVLSNASRHDHDMEQVLNAAGEVLKDFLVRKSSHIFSLASLVIKGLTFCVPSWLVAQTFYRIHQHLISQGRIQAAETLVQMVADTPVELFNDMVWTWLGQPNFFSITTFKRWQDAVLAKLSGHTLPVSETGLTVASFDVSSLQTAHNLLEELRD